MKTKALKIALSAKLNDSEVSIIEKLPVEDLPSTKNVIECINLLSLQGKILFVSRENNKSLIKSCENIEGVDVIEASSLNVYQLLKPKNVILEFDAIAKVQELWGDPDFKPAAAKKPAAKKTTTKKTTTKKTTAKKAPAKRTRKTVNKDA